MPNFEARDADAEPLIVAQTPSPVHEPVVPAIDLSELLQESRILGQPAQVLMAFLVVVPFTAGFDQLQSPTRWLYVFTFLCALAALVLITAPAAQHRLERPLRDRLRFKNRATRTLIAGMMALTISLVLASILVVSIAINETAAAGAAVLVGGLTIISWWVIPLALRRKHEE